MCSLDNRRCFCHRIAIASGTSEMVSLGWVWGFWIMTLQYPSPSLCGGGRVPCSRFLSLLCLYILDGSWWRFSVRSWSWPFWGIGHGRRELVLDTRFFAWFYYSTRIETSTCRSFLILYFFAGLKQCFVFDVRVEKAIRNTQSSVPKKSAEFGTFEKRGFET